MVLGHGFRNEEYVCSFTSPDGTYRVNSTAVAVSQGTDVSSTRLECVTPGWALGEGKSRFTVGTREGRLLAETAGWGVGIGRAQYGALHAYQHWFRSFTRFCGCTTRALLACEPGCLPSTASLVVGIEHSCLTRRGKQFSGPPSVDSRLC